MVLRYQNVLRNAPAPAPAPGNSLWGFHQLANFQTMQPTPAYSSPVAPPAPTTGYNNFNDGSVTTAPPQQGAAPDPGAIARGPSSSPVGPQTQTVYQMPPGTPAGTPPGVMVNNAPLPPSRPSPAAAAATPTSIFGLPGNRGMTAALLDRAGGSQYGATRI